MIKKSIQNYIFELSEQNKGLENYLKVDKDDIIYVMSKTYLIKDKTNYDVVDDETFEVELSTSNHLKERTKFNSVGMRSFDIYGLDSLVEFLKTYSGKNKIKLGNCPGIPKMFVNEVGDKFVYEDINPTDRYVLVINNIKYL